MEKVRTVTPTEGTLPSIGINLLKVIEDNVPVRLREIENEHKALTARSKLLVAESEKLQKLLRIVNDK